LSGLTKKAQLPSGFIFEKLQITGELHFFFLALHLLNLTCCGLGCVSGGELGENTTHAPAGFVRRPYRASIKEVAINWGWSGVARAGRVCNANKNHARFTLS